MGSGESGSPTNDLRTQNFPNLRAGNPSRRAGRRMPRLPSGRWAYCPCKWRPRGVSWIRKVLLITKRAIIGPQLVQNLALIYAWTGEKDLAVKQLRDVAKLPGYLNYGDLRLHP